jgi:hypothetical protein
MPALDKHDQVPDRRHADPPTRPTLPDRAAYRALIFRRRRART